MTFLRNLWLLPVAIPIWLFYLWPAMALGLIQRQVTLEGLSIFHVVPRGNVWIRLWRNWEGHAMPGAVVLNPVSPLPSDYVMALRHERRHVRQWYALGPLFPIVYVLFLLSFGYWNNPLERDARSSEYALPEEP